MTRYKRSTSLGFHGSTISARVSRQLVSTSNNMAWSNPSDRGFSLSRKMWSSSTRSGRQRRSISAFQVHEQVIQVAQSMVA